MTTDEPTFDKPAKATRAQAKMIWDGFVNETGKKRSTRIVAEYMRNRCIDISDRTLARWVAKDFRDETVAPSPETRVNRELNAALKLVPDKTMDDANKIGAAGGLEASMNKAPLTEDDYARIERRRQELLLMDPQARAEVIYKAREVMNILIMEEAARRAHVMVLIPKDTSNMIESFTDAAKQTLVPGGKVEPGDGAHVINGRVIKEPPNPTASAISKFLKESEKV